MQYERLADDMLHNELPFLLRASPDTLCVFFKDRRPGGVNHVDGRPVCNGGGTNPIFSPFGETYHIIITTIAIRCLRQLLRGLRRPPMARFARHTLISLTFSKSLALVASLEKVKYSTWSRKTFKKVCLDSWSSICTDKFTASLIQSVLTIFSVFSIFRRLASWWNGDESCFVNHSPLQLLTDSIGLFPATTHNMASNVLPLQR